MKHLLSKIMLAAFIISLVPVQSAHANWNNIAKLLVTTSVLTVLGFSCGWAADIDQDQKRLAQEVNEHKQAQKAPGQYSHVIAPGGPKLEQHLYTTKRDSRPARFAAHGGSLGLLSGLILTALIARISK